MTKLQPTVYSPRISLFLVFLVALVFITNKAYAASETCDLLLSQNQISALTKADKENYTISLMTGQINGETRNIVLLGESHLKSTVAKQQGKEIIEQFNFRGLEGANLKLTWGHVALSISLFAGFKLMALVSPAKHGESSTIDEAKIDAELRRIAFGIADSLHKNQITLEEASSMSLTVNGDTLQMVDLIKKFG